MTVMAYDRVNPSPRYKELLALYRTMHREGDAEHALKPEQTFAGLALATQVDAVKAMIERYGAESLLDYGCGKASLYFARRIQFPNGRVIEALPCFWGIRTFTLYDPGYPRFAEPPAGSFDGVISTDVLEHCPEEDLPWILAEIMGYARKFVFANIACYPAKKRLPNGENAHATVREPAWWTRLIEAEAARHSALAVRFHFETPQGQSVFDLPPRG
ncbi:MAG TPA: class I SAM-dependent methyltransferase [Alphaproteobacteria bacterium]|nr:class I SAM-dependent methyltransferase [Alphaproteobacteria bacterium]